MLLQSPSCRMHERSMQLSLVMSQVRSCKGPDEFVPAFAVHRISAVFHARPESYVGLCKDV